MQNRRKDERFSGLSEKIEKEKDIKKEINKIKGFLKNIEPKVLKGVTSVIDNVAYMAVTLKELRDEIQVEGVLTEYQNGENQFGVKKSPKIEIYNTMVKNYNSSMKLLLDLLPKNKEITIDDGFEEFVESKN
ncbi:hypothetical protein [Clostridium sp. D53t1_180928_C8]|uniref:hypothetical protein n=1 Tax=Clostridium sp. D53t1_180928_C8 TaxID=2787101 RepID=UPI0018A9C83F|nr:hypothetical protein [Clostridium sp. D53t1_180928_C8]